MLTHVTCNSSPLKKNGRRFGRRHFQMHFREWKWYNSDSISLKCVPKNSFDNKTALVQVMVWRRTVERPLLGQCWPTVSSHTHICGTRGRWVVIFKGIHYNTLGKLQCSAICYFLCNFLLNWNGYWLVRKTLCGKIKLVYYAKHDVLITAYWNVHSTRERLSTVAVTTSFIVLKYISFPAYVRTRSPRSLPWLVN